MEIAGGRHRLERLCGVWTVIVLATGILSVVADDADRSDLASTEPSTTSSSSGAAGRSTGAGLGGSTTVPASLSSTAVPTTTTALSTTTSTGSTTTTSPQAPPTSTAPPQTTTSTTAQPTPTTVEPTPTTSPSIPGGRAAIRVNNTLDREIWINVNDITGPVPARTVVEFVAVAEPAGPHGGVDVILAMEPPRRGSADCFDRITRQVIRPGGSYVIRVGRGFPRNCPDGFPRPKLSIRAR